MSTSTGAKWAKDDGRFGVQLLKKAGWEEGKGLGRHEDGIVENVKTVRKDNVLGIGYEGQVAGQQVWSSQSVGFADILKRINTQSPAPDSGDDVDNVEESATPVASPVNKGPSAGKHAAAYNKRRNLKTEALRSDEGKQEVLGAASSSRKRSRNDDDDEPLEDKSTLVSPILQRSMVRHVPHEPRPSATTSASVVITKPDPRPPKPTDTPFLVSE